MKRWLIKFLAWMIRRLNARVVVIRPEVKMVFPDALKLVMMVNRRFDGETDEFKHHQAYAHLVKLYPDVKRRYVGLAIELAIHSIHLE